MTVPTTGAGPLSPSAPPSPPEEYLDATQAPYNADNSGSVDATSAIESCMAAAIIAEKYAYLPAGTYKVNNGLTVPDSADLRGASKATVTLTSTHSAPVTIDVDAEDVNLQGFKVVGSYTTTNYCILFDEGDHDYCTLTDIDVQDSAYAGIMVPGSATAHYAVFTRVTGSHCDGFGIHYNGTLQSNNVTFLDCHCPYEGYVGDSFEGVSDPPHGFYLTNIHGLIMTDCTGGSCDSGTNSSGFDFDDCVDGTITNCVGHDSKVGIAYNQYPSTGCSNIDFINCDLRSQGNWEQDWKEYGTNTDITGTNCYGTGDLPS